MTTKKEPEMLSPRNEENKSFSLLPPELLETILEIFKDTFQEESTKGDFFCLGQVHQGEILLRLGYVEKGSIKQVNFDTSIDVEPNEPHVTDLLDELIVGTKELFINYFKNKNLEDFSYYWNPLETSKNHAIFYKYDATNTQLEAEANKLLGEENLDSSLIHGDMEESEEIEKIIESLNSKDFKFK